MKNDDQNSLLCRPLGMLRSYGSGIKHKARHLQGASPEFFWDLFIRPLQ